MRQITVRNLSPELMRALTTEARRRSTSVNQTVLDLLARALGLHGERRYSNGLRGLSGDWSQAEFEEFESAVAEFERIDEGAWE